MKLMSFAVPVLIVALLTAAVGTLGLLTVRASAASTQASLDLLRMHLRVARLHEQLLERSQHRLATHAGELPPLAPESAAPALRRLLERIEGGPSIDRPTDQPEDRPADRELGEGRP
ncbi:MAG: hypothetical protein ACJ76Y_21650 [Thermoanaerobaculia bacterium]